MEPRPISQILASVDLTEPAPGSSPRRGLTASAPCNLPLLRGPARHLLALHAAWERADERSRLWGLAQDLWPDPTQHARSQAALEAMLEPGGLVVLAGPRGTGKTFLATWLAWRVWRERMLEGHRTRGRAAYAVWGELVGDELASWKSAESASALAAARRADLLVVDELHTLSGKPWEDQALERLMDQRYRDVHRTIIATNSTAEALAGSLPASTLSRIEETGTVVTWTGPDRRKPQ